MNGNDAQPMFDPADRALYGIRALRLEYRFERWIFLAGGLLSLLFSLAIAVVTLAKGEATPATMLPLLGSGGTFLTTAFGSMFYFSKSHDLLRELLVPAPPHAPKRDGATQ